MVFIAMGNLYLQLPNALEYHSNIHVLVGLNNMPPSMKTLAKCVATETHICALHIMFP